MRPQAGAGYLEQVLKLCDIYYAAKQSKCAIKEWKEMLYTLIWISWASDVRTPDSSAEQPGLIDNDRENNKINSNSGPAENTKTLNWRKERKIDRYLLNVVGVHNNENTEEANGSEEAEILQTNSDFWRQQLR